MFHKMKVFLLLFVLHLNLCAINGSSTFTVTNTNDSGPGSLREAVIRFNMGHHEDDIIEFELPVSGPVQINLLSDIEITRREGCIFSILNKINICGDGLLKTKYPSMKLINFNRIQQPKSLVEIALKAVAKQVVSKKFDIDSVLARIPTDLCELVHEGYVEQLQEELLKDFESLSKLGSWDLQIRQGIPT